MEMIRMINNIKIFNLKNKELVDLIICRKGGRTTMDIIDKILVMPYNTNQLSKILKVDYNTISHHTKIMEEYEFITKNRIRREYYIHPTDKLINSLEEYYYIKEIMDEK